MRSENKLAKRFFLIILLTIAVMFVAVYVISVPLMQKQVFEIERNSARLALNNIFQLTSKMYSNLEGYKQQTLNAHKQRLRITVDLVESQINKTISDARREKLDVPETRKKLAEKFDSLVSGPNNYIWIANHDATLLTQPELSFNESSQEGKVAENDVLRYLINLAVRDGEGYYQYKSTVNNQDKISYVKNYPQWGFIIGSSLTVDDIDSKLELRKAATLKELRQALNNIKIAKTGYLFIFDKAGNMLVHPNSNIDQTNFFDLKNPVTNKSILTELISVSDTGKELYYKWDKPSDPNNYVYEKIALVRFLEEFGWYISSSVYIDELRSSSETLSRRVLGVAFLSIIVALSAAAFFINKILQPIKQLVRVANQINSGDLSAKSNIYSDDEIGVLAHSFDKMVKNLKANIESLDYKVKLSTKELTELEERQRLILDALPAQVAYLNRDLIYIFVNKSYATIFDLPKEDIVGKKIDDVIGKKMLEGITKEIDDCLQGKNVVYEYRFYNDEKEIITKRTLIPDIDENGNVIGLLNLSLDITAEREAERRLTEANRINAVGQLAGGLAHDFNNLLSIILGNLQIIKERSPYFPELEKHIEPSIKASLRGADITERLLTFSRHQALSPVLIDLKTLINNVVELTQSSIPEGISVEYNIESKKSIFVDMSQIENVLVNLILNAKDAIENRGQIIFTFRDLKVDKEIIYDEKVPPGDYVEITVKDTGYGFSDDAKAKACEPFFTTKPHGKGTGLGLSMVYGFIKQSNGYFTINSALGKGASIVLLFPAKDAQPVKKPLVEISKEEPHPLEKKLFLLSEDNADVRAVVREHLVNVGYSVIEASDADEAETLIMSLPHLDGLVTDINMPGKLTGFGLASLMRKQFTDSHIVLMTGYDYGQKDFVDGAQWLVIKKPFDKNTLLDAINQPLTPLQPVQDNVL